MAPKKAIDPGLLASLDHLTPGPKSANGHYAAAIEAFLDSGEERLPLDLDRFRSIVGNPNLRVESIRQGLRMALRRMDLLDEVQVRMFVSPFDPENPERDTITLNRRKQPPIA